MISLIKTLSLTQWILLSMVIGVFIGWAFPQSSQDLKPLQTIFMNLIKSLITPLVFSTLVVGIIGHGDDMKKVGRLALKSIIYFEIVTTLALFIGLGAVNITKPGVGVDLSKAMEEEQKRGDAQKLAQNQSQKSFGDIIAHLAPTSIFKAAAENDVLQLVVWAILFSIACSQVPMKFRKPILETLEAVSQVMFKLTGIVMLYAPIGIGAAMAVTVGHSGLEVLKNLGMLVITLYAALLVLVLGVLLPAALIFRIPLRKFGKAVREPAMIAFSTTSSDAALPKAMQAMESIGVPKRIVSFVMPTGYSFNLDGTTLYLAVASIFAVQASGQEWTLGQQVGMMLLLMLTSKGVAAVPRASLVILAGTLATYNLPLAAVFLILGIDEIMDMARTTVNLVGNCLACCIMARWEGEFDDNATGILPEVVDPDAAATNPANGEVNGSIGESKSITHGSVNS